MEQPRTNAAACIIPMESEVIPPSPEPKPIPESTEFATKIPLKFDPLVVDNSQSAESDSVLNKICVFLLVFIVCSIYNVLGFLVIVFIYNTSQNLLAAYFGVIISQLFLWPFAMSNLSEEDLSLFFNLILYSGLVGIFGTLIRCIYKTKCAENAIRQQNNPNEDANNGNNMQHLLE
ncbi:Hypothetical predicted protein [Cloeon dipterum]|uniref:Uncharacterized protein n=1 Tax=Cloeon dipterum TaxID=197152 RepID=A0A8S1DTB1_9INSE|nr:Hypothetical predicted protein [Cloeon dipterum]